MPLPNSPTCHAIAKLALVFWYVNRIVPEASTGISTSTIVAAGPVVDEKSTPAAIGNEGGDKALVRLLTISVDVIAVSLFIALFSYSVAKLGVEVFDFKSFDGAGEMSMSLTFAWLFSSTTTICLFLFPITRPPEQLTFDIFKKFTDPAVTSGLLSGLIIPVLLALFAFGTTIFPRIPFSMGGGEPREVTMKTKISQDLFDGKRLFLLGESSQFFFVVESDQENARAMQINKDIVEYIEMKRGRMGHKWSNSDRKHPWRSLGCTPSPILVCAVPAAADGPKANPSVPVSALPVPAVASRGAAAAAPAWAPSSTRARWSSRPPQDHVSR